MTDAVIYAGLAASFLFHVIQAGIVRDLSRRLENTQGVLRRFLEMEQKEIDDDIAR